jgi:uncharacterized repeat protein (TIGR03803 family)
MTRIVNRLSQLLAIGAVTAISIHAQTFTTLHSFNGADGDLPVGGLVQGLDGNLYGTTTGGGSNGRGGTVFKITTRGNLTTLYNFCSQSGCTDGIQPYVGALAQATDGSIYGTTYHGGANDLGEIFQVSPSGALTTLYSFCALANCADGAFPQGMLVQSGGYVYGTTSGGGTSPNGSVFKIAPDGTLTTLYGFCSQPNCADGALPGAGLVQGFDGNFYGTTETGGANCRDPGCGTIFKVTPGGALTTLYSFCSQSHCADGATPLGGLVQGNSGDLYGTAQDGGSRGFGTVFKITPDGTFTKIHSFCEQAGCADGSYPNAGLVQGSDGNFYGITTFGGSCPSSSQSGCGTIFKVDTTGALTTLYTFCTETGCPNGETPDAALVQDTNGTFYGTTNFGGAYSGCDEGSCGTVYNLSVGLAPFVKTLPAGGQVGTTVEILGNNLTAPTSVTFNGTPAVVTLVTATQIRATVPAGATTGEVVVTLAGSTLSSNMPFRVLP